MGATSVIIALPTSISVKILKWKVKEGSLVNVGRVILLYDVKANDGQDVEKKFKSTEVGTVRKLFAKEGEVVHPGMPLLELEKCTHPTVFKDMCAECGIDLRKEDDQQVQNASVPMVHSIPELKVSEEQAMILGRADEERLLKHRKLVLLVDLDQTLIHTTNDNIPANLKDVYHFKLYGAGSPWYHTRLRPGTHKFLAEISRLYELHICTFGARNYAHMIAMFLDQDGKFFSHRILSRDECFNPNSKTANLKALFPCGDNMVCIIDDREDVWNYASNLIHVKPYHFFKHTGDINAPPGLSKQENDDKEGFDFTRMGMDKEADPDSDLTKEEYIQQVGDETITQDNLPLDADDLKLGSEPVDSEDLKLGSKPVDSEDLKLGSKPVDSEDLKLGSEPGDSEDLKLGSKPVDCEDLKLGSKPVDCEDLKLDTKPVDDGTKVESKSLDMEVVIDETETVDMEVLKEDSVDMVDAVDSKTVETACVRTLPIEAETSVEPASDSSVDALPQAEPSDVIPSDLKDQITPCDTKESLIPADSDKLDVDLNSVSLNTSTQISDARRLSELDAESIKGDEDLVELEDDDDYLLYLEEILKMIHTAYFQRYDEMSEVSSVKASNQVPDMKEMIPEVRSKVLSGTRLVFSGLVPTHVALEESRAYLVAVSLGAQVTQDLEPNTTHLVAVRSGTAKVNAARRIQGLKKVTPQWLWSCAERWERADERLFPLGADGAAHRHPPAHCASPEHVSTSTHVHGQPGARRRTPSGRFMDTINPLMSFSPEDIANMDREVEDMFNESDEESEGESRPPALTLPPDDDVSSSSAESLGAGERGPRGWGVKRAASVATASDSDDDDFPSTKFRRGEALPSDLDLDDCDSAGSNEPPDEVDDGDWNMMGAALEREFLSGNSNGD